MRNSFKFLGCVVIASTSAFLFAADGDKPAAPPAPNPGKQAIAVHKAAFTLIANSNKPISDAAQGKIEYNQADIQKRANRILVLTEFLDTSFPEAANLGEPDTKAKADIWANKADFDKRVKDLQEHAAALVKVAATEKTATDAFKDAAGALGKDCKGCHDNYKVK